MFTGIVESVGRITHLSRQGEALRMTLHAGTLDLSDVRLGDSIAVSGPCLTVVARGADSFEVDVSSETLARTTLGDKRAGDRVNLEKALRLADRLGGHLVSGHIDGVGQLRRREPQGEYLKLVIGVPAALARYLAFKGSVALDGVSLTVNAAGPDSVEVLTIPHTLERTTLGALTAGAALNIEVDLIARYIERLLASSTGGDAIDLAMLSRAGFVADGG